MAKTFSFVPERAVDFMKHFYRILLLQLVKSSSLFNVKTFHIIFNSILVKYFK